MLRELDIATPFAFPLPASIFFRPKANFIEWVRGSHGGRKVYDVGAGCGQVSAALSAAGVAVEALDIFRREAAEFRVLFADGTAYDYDRGSTVMLCRPCHGLFTQAVIKRAVECGAARVLYVGLPRNRKDDLGPFARRFRKVLANAGRDGEYVYELSLKDGATAPSTADAAQSSTPDPATPQTSGASPKT